MDAVWDAAWDAATWFGVSWTVLPLLTTTLGLLIEFGHWLMSEQGQARASMLSPTELREVFRDRLLNNWLHADAAGRLPYLWRVLTTPSLHWTYLVWCVWANAQTYVVMWGWRWGWSREFTVTLLCSLSTVQVTGRV